jgi:hypothetical protein
MKKGLTSLKRSGCKRVYIDGSFVTDKKVPGDFDACWDEDGVDLDLLLMIESTILTFDNWRAAQKVKYGGEFFPAHIMATADMDYISFFQIDRSGNPKGIVAIDLIGSTI